MGMHAKEDCVLPPLMFDRNYGVGFPTPKGPIKTKLTPPSGVRSIGITSSITFKQNNK